VPITRPYMMRTFSLGEFHFLIITIPRSHLRSMVYHQYNTLTVLLQSLCEPVHGIFIMMAKKIHMSAVRPAHVDPLKQLL